MTCLRDYLTIKGDGYTVFHGSNLDVLPLMADNSVDSIVTDPPYELGFMGKKWDSTGIAYSVELWEQCLRVLKPGGHLLAFGGSRTWHRLAVAIEDAGFEVRDSIAWLYGSGFPKSHNVALGIDKMLGHGSRGRAIPVASKFQASDIEEKNKLTSNPVEAYAAKSPEALKWEGWGTALKPAFEPVVVARKPLDGTVAANVLEWGVGGLNIDASRIAANGDTLNRVGKNRNDNLVYGAGLGTDSGTSQALDGRWPANIILDKYTAELLDEQSGFSKSSGVINRWVDGAKPFGGGAGHEFESVQGVADSGGASRFFYISKANKKDRNEGLNLCSCNELSKIGQHQCAKCLGIIGGHPTVKPTDLMRYLIKLVTPAGSVVLDPFTGSGSTGKAALLDGYEFIGIELTEDYLPIIEGRLKFAKEKNNEGLFNE